MEIKYNKTGKDRKVLVDAISNIIGEPAVYLATPTFAYKIGDWYTVTKDGNLDIFDRADSEEVENLIEQLYKLGFTAEPRDEIELVILGVDEGSDEPEGFSIGMPISELSDKPFSEDTLFRFNDIVSSKRTLFQKALGTTSELITEREEDTLWFDWFDRMIDKEHLEIYSTFIKALYKFAENAKRVNVSHNEIENEKFTMRTFLNRIGLSGDEHKLLRKELMKNLSGNSAFRYGGKLMFPSKEIVERVRKTYPAGTRVELVRMDDCQAPPIGTKGTVTAVDDTASLIMEWDNGCGLNVVYGVDEVRKITD